MRRLHTRIFLHLLGVLVVVGLVTVGVFATGWRSAFPHALTERLLTFGASEVSEHFDDVAARDRTVSKMASQLAVDVTVRDPSGRALIARGEALPALSDAERDEASHGAIKLRRGRGKWYVAGPIVDGESGALRGIIEVSPVRRFRSPSPLRPVLMAALALLLAGALSLPLARRISRPVERLTEATRRFGDGDLKARVPVEPSAGVRILGLRRRIADRARHHRIDELEELSRAWNEMADRVERLVRGQKELLANVSHELRSPLARMRVALELLPRAPADEARIRDIDADLGELDRLIDDVLTASRLEATGLPTHPGRVEIEPLLAGLAERALLDPLVAGHPVVAEPAGDLTLIADGALLRRALWNLIENAAKYGSPPIVLAARADGERVVLSVTDAGGGIQAADRERVLDPFARLDRARTPSRAGESPRGFGLGLTIARRVAEVHRGTIRIEPARVEAGVESGCRVLLDLPRGGAPSAWPITDSGDQVN